MRVRRRDFITLAGGAAAWPLAAQAQQAAIPVIGWLGPVIEASRMTGFRKGLSDTGNVEGRNVAIAFQTGDYDRMPALAVDLVHRRVAVIVAAGGIVQAEAAKAATTTIPIVYVIGADPVEFGFAASMNRPAGNMSGVSLLSQLLTPKRLEALRDLAPKAKRVGALMNPTKPNVEADIRDVQAAAGALGMQIQVANASREQDFEPAFALLKQQNADALLIGTDGFFTSRLQQLAALAARYSLPAIGPWREFAQAGGLASYGTDYPDAYRQAGLYVGRILNGEKPADLPVQAPTKFELVINLRTARALGLIVPPSLLATADEVIE